MLPEDMVGIYAASQVAYCPSVFESFHIASGEALCCGCSVVAARSDSLAAFQWFAQDGAGTLASKDDTEGHLNALKEELASWESGHRNPESIALLWGGRLHADRVAAQAAGFLEGKDIDHRDP